METVEPAVVRAAAGQALTRREFGAAAAGVAIGLSRESAFARASARQAVTIGVQSYSFRDRSLDDAIAAMNKLGLKSCELWQAHIEPRNTPREELRKWRETVPLDVFHAVRDKLARAAITLNAYNISITDTFSDAEIERAFDMTRALGAPLITSSSNIKTVARIAPVAEKRKIVVAMHNHSRIDPNEFATAKSLTDAMAANRYIWTNLDIGHFTATNEDAIAFIKQHHARIVTLHIKDRKRDQGPNVEFGAGDTPIVAALQLVRDNGWPIPMNIEYEYKGADTVDEVGKCLAYCRRALGL
ncbi:MAG: sugar phosphate isomerase/epimerase [Cyanobacteria bacterium]|nr:sugar phosphate isomerase/epimerase [Cyanobacteriota bacterium]